MYSEYTDLTAKRAELISKIALSQGTPEEMAAFNVELAKTEEMMAALEQIKPQPVGDYFDAEALIKDIEKINAEFSALGADTSAIKGLDTIVKKFQLINDRVEKRKDLEEDIVELQKKGAGALNEEGKSLKDLMEEREKAKEAGETGVAETLEMVSGYIEATASFIESSVEGISNMVTAIQSGDVGGAITEGADLVQKIGKALLSSGIPPLAAAGAALLIAGTIGKIFQTLRG